MALNFAPTFQKVFVKNMFLIDLLSAYLYKNNNKIIEQCFFDNRLQTKQAKIVSA
jgi:hypothetical protein